MTIGQIAFYLAGVVQIACVVATAWLLRRTERNLIEGRAQIAYMDEQIERIGQAEQQYRAAEASFRATVGLPEEPHWYN
jgi:hypothetical protein